MSSPDVPWSQADDPLPVRLVNTVRAERGRVRDDLRRPDDLDVWLRAAGFGALRPTAADLGAARELRDGLRTLLAHATGDSRPVPGSASAPVPDDELLRALDVVNGHAHPRPPDRLVLADGALRRAPVPVEATVAAALAVVREAAVELLTGPDAAALRACAGPRCVLYFVRDHPRREWCSTACGNRARAARHYHRHRDPVRG